MRRPDALRRMRFRALDNRQPDRESEEKNHGPGNRARDPFAPVDADKYALALPSRPNDTTSIGPRNCQNHCQARELVGEGFDATEVKSVGRVGGKQAGWCCRSQRLLNAPQRASNGAGGPPRGPRRTVRRFRMALGACIGAG